VNETLELIVTVTANVKGSKIYFLWILNEKEKALKIRTTQAITEEYLKGRSLKLGEGVVGYVAEQIKPLTILNVLKEFRYKEKELPRMEGSVSIPVHPWP
jgi:signal transduction protein with GAF and PtsI domain